MIRSYYLSSPLILLLLALLVLVQCTPEFSGEASYHGIVHELSTDLPFANLDVKVTDGENVHTQTKTNADGEFTLTIKIKEINDQYYILVGDETCEKKRISFPGYAEGVNEIGIILVDGPHLPTVETSELYTADATSLRCGGIVTDSGRLLITERGICYSTKAYPTIDDKKCIEGKGTGEFSCVIQDLTPGVNYYFRAYAVNKVGPAYGKQYSVTTNDGLPNISSVQVMNIGAETADCYATITSNGGFKIEKIGVCWSKSSSTPTIADAHTEEVAKEGEFTSKMVGLEANTDYYCRVYAINSRGEKYSESIPFKTIDGLPEVESSSVSGISSTSFIFTGKVVSDYGFNVTSRGVVVSTHQNPTIDDMIYPNGYGLGEFSSTVDNLNEHTLYYARAYASNKHGTNYGKDVSVTTNFTIHGVVQDTDKNPISNASVKIKSGPTVSTKNDGQFDVSLPEGTYSVTVSASGFVSNTFSMTADGSYKTFTLNKMATLSGQVVDQDNKPLKNVSVVIKSSAGGSKLAESNTNNDGHYEVGGLSPSSVYITFKKENYATSNKNLTLSPGINNYNCTLSIENECTITPVDLSFECGSSGLYGTTVSSVVQLCNMTQTQRSWSISGKPQDGIAITPTNGTLNGGETVNINVVFTFPGPSVPNSLKYVVLYTGQHTPYQWVYTWNWAKLDCRLYYQGPSWSTYSVTASDAIIITFDGTRKEIPVSFFSYINEN